MTGLAVLMVIMVAAALLWLYLGWQITLAFIVGAALIAGLFYLAYVDRPAWNLAGKQRWLLISMSVIACLVWLYALPPVGLLIGAGSILGYFVGVWCRAHWGDSGNNN